MDLLVSNSLLLLICLWILGFKLIVFKAVFFFFSPPGLLCCCYSPHLLHILQLVSETKYTNCMKTICTQSRPAKTMIPSMRSIQKSHEVSACMGLQTAILGGGVFLFFVFFNSSCIPGNSRCNKLWHQWRSARAVERAFASLNQPWYTLAANC